MFFLRYECNPLAPISATFISSSTSYQPSQQQMFAPTPGTFTPDIYSAAPHNMVFTSGGQVGLIITSYIQIFIINVPQNNSISMKANIVFCLGFFPGLIVL